MSISLGTILTIIGILTGITGIAAAIYAKGQEKGKISTQLALMRQEITGTNTKLKDNGKSIEKLEFKQEEMGKDIVRIEASTKSAHLRINEIRDKLNFNLKENES